MWPDRAGSGQVLPFFLLDSAAVTLRSGCWGGVACAAPVLSGGQGDDLRSPGVKQRAR